MRRLTDHRRSMPGFTVCAHCLEITDNVDLREVVRPGCTKGVWVCKECANQLTGECCE